MRQDRIVNQVTDPDVVCLYDPRENARWGLLRSLPALYYLGVTDFTYPTSWCQFGRGDRYFELDYDYHVVSNDLDIPEDEPDFGVVTNEYYEEETPYTIKFLINRYTVADETLFVVTDDRLFQPQGAVRPLAQEPFVDDLGRYSSIYDTFASAYREAGWELPLTGTKNLFLQDNANLYRLVADEQLTDTIDLFNVLPDAPYLPLFDALADVFSRPEELGAVPLDAEEGLPNLVKWLRRRIEWDRETARTVAADLNDAVVADGSTLDTAAARRDPSIAQARRAARELDPEASDIDRRYADWLNRYQL